MSGEIVEQEGFTIAGISVRTSNNPIKLMMAIPPLWKRFMGEKIADSLVGRMGEEIYVSYTDYEGDHTQPYSYVIGCRVDPSAKQTVEGLHIVEIASGAYNRFTATGSMPQALMSQWQEIWKMPLERAYKADFEVHPKDAGTQGISSVDIYVGV